MNGFKLRVGDRSLSDSRELIVVAEVTKIGEEVNHAIWRRRHVVGVTRAVVSASKPVLLVSNYSALGRETRSRHELAMDVNDVCRFDRSHGIGDLDCPGHGVDVSKDFFRCNVVSGFAEFASHLCAKKSATSDLEAFDLRRSDCLGPKQESGEAVESGESRSLTIEYAYC